MASRSLDWTNWAAFFIPVLTEAINDFVAAVKFISAKSAYLAELAAIGAIVAVNAGPQTRYQLHGVFLDGAIEPLNEPLNVAARGAIEGINEGINDWLLRLVETHIRKGLVRRAKLG